MKHSKIPSASGVYFTEYTCKKFKIYTKHYHWNQWFILGSTIYFPSLFLKIIDYRQSRFDQTNMKSIWSSKTSLAHKYTHSFYFLKMFSNVLFSLINVSCNLSSCNSNNRMMTLHGLIGQNYTILRAQTAFNKRTDRTVKLRTTNKIVLVTRTTDWQMKILINSKYVFIGVFLYTGC